MANKKETKQTTPDNPQTEEDFRLMVEAIQDYAIFRLDPEGRITSWNLGAERIKGYKAGEIMGQHFSIFYPPEAIARKWPEQILERVKRDGQYHEEGLRVRKNGHLFWANVTITALYGESGNLRGFSKVTRDITQRKQAEAELAKQATELATVTQISAIISTIRDPQAMLQAVVDLTKERFGLYHVHIYLLNETTGFLTLMAGAGEVGQRMVTEGRSIALEQVQSLVARAARIRQGVIVNDVRTDLGFLPHPLLPDTRSEMAVPVLIGDDVLGVLDVQSSEVDHFTANDVRIQTALAAQIAVALQNARSFEQAEQALEELHRLTRRLTREGWDKYLESKPDELAYHYDLQQISPLDPSVSKFEADTPPGQSKIEKPLILQGEAIGQVTLTEPQVLVNESGEIVEAVVERLSAHLENLRLSEQTGRALAEVESLYQASTQVIQARTVDEVLKGLIYNSAFQRLDRVTLLFFNRPWAEEWPESMIPLALWERDNENPIITPGTQYALKEFPVIGFFSPDEPTILTDIAADNRADANTRAFLVGELGIRSLIVFPLVVSGQWLGVITGQGYTTLSLNEAEVRQLKSLTDQAATVIQTHRLVEQTQQALSSTQRLFEAGRRLNTASDLQAAVAAVVGAVPLPEINRAVLLLFERNTGDEVEAAIVAANWHSGTGSSPTPLGTRYLWKIIEVLKFALSADPIFFNDTATDPRVDRNARKVFEQQNIRALAALPLWVGTRQLGILLLEAEEIHLFTNDEIEPYTALAGQLAIVIDRQNLLEQTQATLTETRTLYQTGQALALANSLDEILQAVGLAEIMPGPGNVSLSTLEVDEAGQPEWSTLAANWSPTSDPSSSLPVGTRFYLPDFPLSRLWMADPGKVVLIEDVNTDERVDPVLQQLFQQSQVTAMALMPLSVRGTWIGLTTITWSTLQTFTERHQRLFNSLALQVAGAVNNQLLLDQTQVALVEQERLAVDLDNQRNTFQTILQSIPVGVFVVDTSTGKPILANRQAQEILGKGIAPDVDKDALTEVYAAYRYGTEDLYPTNELPLVRGMSGEITTVEDMEIRRPDGKRILLQVFGAPIRDTADKIIASVAIFQDITEQTRATQEREQLLAEVQAAYRQFVQREWRQFLDASHKGHWLVEHQQPGTALEPNSKMQKLQDEVSQAGKLKAVSLVTDHEQGDQPAIVAPISLRGQVIGTLSLQDIDPGRRWTAEEIALVETVSEQLAQTVENLRLFEETQKRATREQLTREITDKMRALPDMDSIIQTGLAELAQALGVSRTYVKLTSRPEQLEDISTEIDALRSQLKPHGQQKR